MFAIGFTYICLLYTSDAADEEDSVDLGCCRIINKKKNKERNVSAVNPAEQHDGNWSVCSWASVREGERNKY